MANLRQGAPIIDIYMIVNPEIMTSLYVPQHLTANSALKASGLTSFTQASTIIRNICGTFNAKDQDQRQTSFLSHTSSEYET